MARRDGRDDGPLHDANDDNLPRHSGLDDGPTHDANDDNLPRHSGLDDGPAHDANDDNLPRHSGLDDGPAHDANDDNLPRHSGLDDGPALANSAKLVAAAFGANAVHEHADYVGAGLQLFNAAHSLHDIAELAAKAMGMDDSAFINAVYKNVAGELPTHEARDFYESLLQGHGGTMTQGDLLVLAANTQAVAQQIDLVGLLQSAADYM
jgi:hypothetical protein